MNSWTLCPLLLRAAYTYDKLPAAEQQALPNEGTLWPHSNGPYQTPAPATAQRSFGEAKQLHETLGGFIKKLEELIARGAAA